MVWWWWIYTCLLAAAVLILWWRAGPRRAILGGVLLSLLVPEWVRWYPLEQGGLLPPDASFNGAEMWMNVRVAVGLFAIVLFTLHPKSTINWKFVWTDWALLGLMLTHLASDLLANGMDWKIPFRIYGEWYLPYILGRMAIQCMPDVRWALPIAVGVTLVLAIFSVAEAVGELDPNPSEMLAGFEPRPEDGTPREGERMGFKRAYGPTMHPIYFATLQFLLLPWMLYAAAKALKSQSNPIWWAAMPIVCAFGVVGAISRAPLLAIGILAYVMVMIASPKRRKALAIVGAAVVLALGLGWDQVVGRLEKSLGQDQQTIVAKGKDGKYKKWTGTRHRLLIFEEYWPALTQTGLFGWGTHRLAGFPADVPRSSDSRQNAEVVEAPPPPVALTSAQRRLPAEMRPPRTTMMHVPLREADIATLDNSYLLFTLRFGFVGLIFYTALIATSAWNFIRLALMPHAAGRVWLSAGAGAVVAMGFVLLTVWMPQDFGFFFLFTMGASAGLLVEEQNPMLPLEESERHQEKPKRRRKKKRRTSKQDWRQEKSTGATQPLAAQQAEAEPSSSPAALADEEQTPR